MVIDPTNGSLYVATYNGLFRTKYGGNSFAKVLHFQGGEDKLVEVSITSTGRIYVTFPTDGEPSKGFFTSADGDI
ncbi:hypothetical protein [Aquimarina sp. RZ0]|uniref:hypothetical protein n=1 Tax=Aquimarina sp. RZ0 TaxID=2607730 RepID=UPI0011F38B4A|nr:hypothetical protein [Aquimarina sp. RZ0]KAA1246558.1 hypothetical protein F0000_07290 [Aquimarina sp. RZ0]